MTASGERSIRRKKKCRECGYFAQVDEENKCKECADGEMAGKPRKDQRETDDECGDCNRRVRSDQHGILCDNCSKWYHCGCEGIDVGEYKMLMKLTENSYNRMRWQCKHCDNQLKGLMAENGKLREDNKKLREENFHLVNRVEKLEKKIENIEKYMEMGTYENADRSQPNLSEQVVEKIKNKVLEEIREGEEREKKKENLIIFNLPESNSSEAKEREEYDTNLCKELFQDEIKVREFEVVKVIRLGKKEDNVDDRHTKERRPEGRPRPILVKLGTATMKWDIVKNARKLKDTENEMFQRVAIVPDKTKRERELDQKLREELREKQERGESGWYIRKGNLHKRNFY